MPKQLYTDILHLLEQEEKHVEQIDTSTANPDDAVRAILKQLQPYDLANLLPELTDEQQHKLLNYLKPARAAETLGNVDHDLQYALLDHWEPDKAQAVLVEMPSDNLVDLLGAIHPLRAQVLLKLLPVDRKEQIEQLMTYPDDTAGGRMTVSYLSARKYWTVQQAIEHFRKVGRGVEITSYIYIVDEKGRLSGVASMRDIFLNEPQKKISELMFTNVISVEASTNQEEAATLLDQYDFLALPVIDKEKRLVGVITFDDVMDVLHEEATEDFQRMGGSQPLSEPYLQTNIFTLFRSRIGWLLVLFVAESLTGTIMRNFENVLEQVVALAFFIPLLIDTGGNSGSQASTLVIRAMTLGEVTLKDFVGVVWREARVSFLLGAVMAVVGFLRAMMLGGPMSLGLTVGITICVIVIVGSTVGAALPLIGKRLGVDPAVVSGPLITTIADGFGLFIYFYIATWLMNLAV